MLAGVDIRNACQRMRDPKRVPASVFVSDETMIVRNPIFIEFSGNQFRRIRSRKDITGGLIDVDVLAGYSGDTQLGTLPYRRRLLVGTHNFQRKEGSDCEN